MQRIAAFLRQRYLEVDPRSLGLFRIVYGLILMLDLAKRAEVLPYFYTNDGLLPNHVMLWSPAGRHAISFFFTLSTQAEAIIGFLLCGLVFLCFMLGFKTRLFHALTIVCLISLNSRIIMLENGGDMVMNLLAIWSFFLPLGRRFSVDALLASWKARREQTPEQLQDRAPLQPDNTPSTSVAYLALLLQFSVIYFFNAIHKDGDTWLEGTAVHYTLHQDRLVTWLGVWIREWLPAWGSQALTWSTLAIEAAAPILILTPIGTRWARRIAAVTMPLLHVGFSSFLDLGVFSYAMMSFFALLPGERDWETLRHWLQRATRERVVYYDASCGICFQTARLFARLDRLTRIRFVPNTEASPPQGKSPDLADRTIVVHVPDTHKWYTRTRAFAQMLQAVPMGWLLAWPLRLPGVRHAGDFVYARIARNRTEISTWLGLAACGLPGTGNASGGAGGLPEPPTPARRSLRRLGVGLRETAALVLMAACAIVIVHNNVRAPEWMPEPRWATEIIEYPRILQGWYMFAPEAPLRDENICVDAVTVDGRHVDPYNEVASSTVELPCDGVPAHLQQGQFFTSYSLFIPRQRYEAYHHVLKSWILDYHERTGNPNDRIVSFKAYEIWDHSPPPGETGTRHVTKKVFLQHRAGSR